MYLINDFALYSLYITIFVISFFTFEKIKSLKSVASLGIHKQAGDFIFGAVLGSITLLMQVVNEELSSSFNLPLYISTAILMMLLVNYIAALYSIAPSLLFSLLVHDIEGQLYVVISIMFIVMIIHQILITTLNFKATHWITISVVASMTLIVFLIVGLGYEHNLGRKAFEQSALIFLFIPFGYSITFWILKFSISSRLLYESANFVYSRFYRAGLTSNAIANFISQNKTSKGIFGVFDIRYRVPNSEVRQREIIKTILQHISDTLPEKSVLFDATMGRYGFFIPIKTNVDIKYSIKGNYIRARQRGDALYPIENLMNSCQIKLMTTWNEEVDIVIKTGASIYGVQSNSIKELMEYSTYALHTINRFSAINVFNPKKMYRRKRDNTYLSLLDERLQLDNFDLKENTLSSLEGGKNILYLDVENISEFTYIETIDEMIYSLGWQDIFNRYNGASAVEEFSKRKDMLMFDYSPSILTSDFDVYEFERNIDAQGVSPENIVLYFKNRGMEQIKDFEILEKALKKVKQKHIKIALEMPSVNSEKIMPYVDFICVDNLDTAKQYLNRDQKLILLDKNDLVSEDELKTIGISYKLIS